MCGIAGAIGHIDETVRRALMLVDLAQAHRGPDAQGVWIATGHAHVAFAHRRLAILDLDPSAAQPMHDEVRGNVLIFNGEIYNYQELRAELQGRGERFRTSSDTEVLLKAWGVFGERCLERLRGMFAFAIYDAAAHTVWIARDRVGIKPLYYTTIENSLGARTILFASELRALLASGLVDRRLDPVSLANYLWNGFVPGPDTIVQGVTLLPAGTSAHITIEDVDVSPRRYWTIPTRVKRTVQLDEFAHTLFEAVGQHLASDVPLGVFLSGGVDSSAVANLAARHHPGIHTFHVGFAEEEYDESHYARAVAEGIGSKHCEICLSQTDFRTQLPAALDSIDQPTFDAINTYFVSRIVREAGITVALAGTGGDELFGGYKTFRDLPYMRRLSRLLGSLPETLVRQAGSVITRLKTGPVRAIPPQVRWGKLGDALATRGSLVDLYQVSYALYTQGFLETLIADERIAVMPYGLMPQQRSELTALVAGVSDLQAISILELSSFIGERLIRDTDTASMAVSLEVRVPLLDHEVIEMALALEEGERFRPLGTKPALRQVGLEGLDPAIFQRPKAGFVLPIERWCREDLAPEVDAVLSDANACRTVGLAPLTVSKFWHAFQEGSQGLYWTRVWALFVLLRWCTHHRVCL